jgi:hypothetical protein
VPSAQLKVAEQKVSDDLAKARLDMQTLSK